MDRRDFLIGASLATAGCSGEDKVVGPDAGGCAA